MGKLTISVLSFLLLVGFVSAQISINEPEDNYNLGDKLYVSVSGLRGLESGNLNVDLQCGESNVNLLKISARAFSSSSDQTYSIPYKYLTMQDLEIQSYEPIVGTCKLVATLSGDIVSTKNFEISKELILNTNLDKLSYNPGDAVVLDISAKKSNGEKVLGILELSNYTSLKETFEEKRSISFIIDEDAAAGDYPLTVHVYEEDGEMGILNEMTNELKIKINQVPTVLDLGLSNVNAIPGKPLTISVDMLDQIGNVMPGEISVVVNYQNGQKESHLVSSGNLLVLDLPTNAPRGTMTISASINELRETTEINIEELKKIQMLFEGPKLIINNVGNVPYDESVNVTIGNEIKSLDVKIGVGDSKEFNLFAPSGEYDISANDGESEIAGSVLLTGNVISIKGSGDNGLWDFSLLWIFLIIVASVVGIIAIRRFSPTKTINPPKHNKKKLSLSNPFKSNTGKPFVKKEMSGGNGKMVDFTTERSGDAESSLVIKGQKENSSVLAVSLDNYKELSGETQDKIKQILKELGGRKGLVDFRGDYALMIYSPLITRTYHNEALAARAGLDLKKILEAHNHKFREKIKFGIGVNSGDLVCAKEGGKLKYTGIGTTIPFARKLSSLTGDDVLVSDSVHKKLLHDAKPKKVGEVNGNSYYSISTFRNKAVDEAKLKELLKRMD